MTSMLPAAPRVPPSAAVAASAHTRSSAGLRLPVEG